MVKADNGFPRKLAYLLHYDYDHIKSTSPVDCWYGVGHYSKPYLNFLYAEAFERPKAKIGQLPGIFIKSLSNFVAAHIIPTDVKKSHTTQYLK